MVRRAISGVGVLIFLAMGSTLAGEIDGDVLAPSDDGLSRAFRGESRLKDDKENTITLVKWKVEDLRKQLREAEVELEQVQASMHPGKRAWLHVTRQATPFQDEAQAFPAARDDAGTVKWKPSRRSVAFEDARDTPADGAEAQDTPPAGDESPARPVLRPKLRARVSSRDESQDKPSAPDESQDKPQTKDEPQDNTARGEVQDKPAAKVQTQDKPADTPATTPKVEVVVEPSKPQAKASSAPGPKAELDAQADRLRAEIELATLSHKVEANALQAMMSAIRSADLGLDITPDASRRDRTVTKAELRKVREKLTAAEDAFLKSSSDLSAKKRQLKKLRAELRDAE
ncbi:hypothetical protein [Singulisphaera sp. PoT]|uniref:hypothetical protein n=1 Tax=Singulisphaera sp. PoT TaxID=3411797 RepID=UPI003BF5FAF6